MKFMALMNPLIYASGVLTYLLGVNLGLAIAHVSVFLALAYSLNLTANRFLRRVPRS